MPIYQYSARDEQGQLVSERIAFRDEIGLRHHLRKNNLFVLQVAEYRPTRIRLRRSVRLGDLIIMARQLRTMIDGGMPLVSGLEALAEQTPNPRLAEILSDVARAVTSGRSLASALSDYPAVFPEMLITLVRSGEEGGRLPEALQEASRQLELQMEVRQKLISALMYPAVTLAATALTVAVMLIFIVPVFADIYRQLNATLPPPTLFLIWLSDVLVHQSWIVAMILVGLYAAFRRFYRTPEGRLKIDTWKLRLPLFGGLFRKSASANLTGSLSGLLNSGVPLLQALQTSSRACGNEMMGDAIRRAAHNVSLGRRLSDEMEQSGHFPLMVVRMIAIAEESGNLPEVLKQIAAAYIEEVEYTIRRIMTVIEPVMVLVVGGIVGFVLVCLYYPIFNMANVFLEGA
jgi:type IV pilus assembly protein PilC